MEYGELAVNYNNGDPAIFIKDSADNIIRIAGSGNISSGDTPNGPVPPSTGNEIGDLFLIQRIILLTTGMELSGLKSQAQKMLLIFL